ncbi:hypothetical protein L596_019234 [Steinernema carpocapsae]|uniref:DUF38 domain-containing protein n=1 Tax=Steinernema carpocapsae TaxID=34508 RepID=A0A4U5MPW6_STECR|nr:hypothetical protein L596_019234 [Steinernema carpocapsae]
MNEVPFLFSHSVFEQLDTSFLQRIESLPALWSQAAQEYQTHLKIIHLGIYFEDDQWYFNTGHEKLSLADLLQMKPCYVRVTQLIFLERFHFSEDSSSAISSKDLFGKLLPFIHYQLFPGAYLRLENLAENEDTTKIFKELLKMRNFTSLDIENNGESNEAFLQKVIDFQLIKELIVLQGIWSESTKTRLCEAIKQGTIYYLDLSDSHFEIDLEMFQLCFGIWQEGKNKRSITLTGLLDFTEDQLKVFLEKESCQYRPDSDHEKPKFTIWKRKCSKKLRVEWIDDAEFKDQGRIIVAAESF